MHVHRRSPWIGRWHDRPAAVQSLRVTVAHVHAWASPCCDTHSCPFCNELVCSGCLGAFSVADGLHGCGREPRNPVVGEARADNYLVTQLGRASAHPAPSPASPGPPTSAPPNVLLPNYWRSPGAAEVTFALSPEAARFYQGQVRGELSAGHIAGARQPPLHSTRSTQLCVVTSPFMCACIRHMHDF